MVKMKVKIENMHCMGCVKRAENALKKVKGLKVTESSLENKTLCLESKAAVDNNLVLSLLAEAGFNATISINE